MEQRSSVRPSAYLRLHENRWVDSDEKFITEEMWRNSLRDIFPDSYDFSTYALDGSINDDCTALVGCKADKKRRLVFTTDVHIWEPRDGLEIDQDEVMKVILNLYKTKMLRPPLYYDKAQVVKLVQDLRRLGVPCREFKQGEARILADTFLYKLYNKGEIVNPYDALLRQHILAASAKSLADNKVRIIKPGELVGSNDSSDDSRLLRKVDAAVSQSMAAYMAYTKSSGGWGNSTTGLQEDKNGSG